MDEKKLFRDIEIAIKELNGLLIKADDFRMSVKLDIKWGRSLNSKLVYVDEVIVRWNDE